MDNQIRRLVDKARAKLNETPTNKRLLIAVAGIPASGKTTLAQRVTAGLNDAADAAGAGVVVAIHVPMDGFHLTRAELDLMPAELQAHARRGAAFTFDAAAFLALVQAVRRPLPGVSVVAPAPPPPPDESLTSSSAGPPAPVVVEDASGGDDVAATTTTAPAELTGYCLEDGSDGGGGVILAPSFDHKIKDPCPGDIKILPSHRAVIFEGNYVAFDRDVWRDAAALMDELWFVHVDRAVARARLVRRHVAAGICPDTEAAAARADGSDLRNADDILGHRLQVHETVISTEDEDWATR